MAWHLCYRGRMCVVHCMTVGFLPGALRHGVFMLLTATAVLSC